MLKTPTSSPERFRKSTLKECPHIALEHIARFQLTGLITRIFAEHTKKSDALSILDAGAGECMLYDFLPSEVTYYALDKTFDKESYIPAMTATKSLLERTPFDSSSFDVIACLETLEHLSNPYTGLEEIKRVVRPEGQIILSFPNPSAEWLDDPVNPWHLSHINADQISDELTEHGETLIFGINALYFPAENSKKISDSNSSEKYDRYIVIERYAFGPLGSTEPSIFNVADFEDYSLNSDSSLGFLIISGNNSSTLWEKLSEIPSETLSSPVHPCWSNAAWLFEKHGLGRLDQSRDMMHIRQQAAEGRIKELSISNENLCAHAEAVNKRKNLLQNHCDALEKQRELLFELLSARDKWRLIWKTFTIVLFTLTIIKSLYYYFYDSFNHSKKP